MAAAGNRWALVPRHRLSTIALATLLACGGTTGLENVLASSDPPADDSRRDATSVADPSTDTLDSAGMPPLDATVYDRSVPPRPPPMDTGAPVTFDRDSAATSVLDAAGSNDDAGPATTESVLAAQSPNCLTFEPDGAIGGCAAVNGCLDPTQQGGVCETVTGRIRAGTGVTEAQLCIQTLQVMFASKCAAAMSETPCLCGDAAPVPCLGGTATPNGPLYADYTADFGPNINAVEAEFTAPSFGAGQANSIAECLLQWGCMSCFGVGDGGAGEGGAGK
jgi:hypothetical protein